MQERPAKPYVKQHYARMLLRAGKTELALDQINSALSLDSDATILYHTKGVILMNLAHTIISLDVARKRLAQSEDAFRKALKSSRGNEYCYQGLSQLYIGWAYRARTEEEATDYITKAETIIDEGLRVVRVRDSLWIESSNIQKFLGDKPRQLDSLKRAIQSNPQSIIGRLLLGKFYRKSGINTEALDVLEPTIQNHPEEFRSFVEYALAMLNSGRSYSDAIAILRLSTIYGLGDPRFISVLGGLHFLAKEYQNAREVFAEYRRRNFTFKEINSIQFRPTDPTDLKMPLKFEGLIVNVKAGYSLIEVTGYPPFLCPGSKYNGLLMQRDLRVRFTVGFCSKGPIALQPIGI